MGVWGHSPHEGVLPLHPIRSELKETRSLTKPMPSNQHQYASSSEIITSVWIPLKLTAGENLMATKIVLNFGNAELPIVQ